VLSYLTVAVNVSSDLVSSTISFNAHIFGLSLCYSINHKKDRRYNLD
jgi:hypothetical protein